MLGEDCLREMRHVRHLVGHKNGQRKVFSYLDLASDFYNADAASSNCIWKTVIKKKKNSTL